jgi:hypothetical protein
MECHLWSETLAANVASTSGTPRLDVVDVVVSADRKHRHDDLADADPAGDTSPCCCASLKWRHRIFGQIGA